MVSNPPSTITKNIQGINFKIWYEKCAFYSLTFFNCAINWIDEIGFSRRWYAVLNQIQLDGDFEILVKEHLGDIGKSFILVPKNCMTKTTSWFQSVLFSHAKPEFYVFQAFFLDEIAQNEVRLQHMEFH